MAQQLRIPSTRSYRARPSGRLPLPSQRITLLVADAQDGLRLSGLNTKEQQRAGQHQPDNSAASPCASWRVEMSLRVSGISSRPYSMASIRRRGSENEGALQESSGLGIKRMEAGAHVASRRKTPASTPTERRCRLSDFRHRRFQPDVALISQHQTRFRGRFRSRRADDALQGDLMLHFYSDLRAGRMRSAASSSEPSSANRSQIMIPASPWVRAYIVFRAMESGSS